MHPFNPSPLFVGDFRTPMNYIGFYWTLPVNWAGFTTLPSDADAAAKVSCTIRYQVVWSAEPLSETRAQGDWTWARAWGKALLLGEAKSFSNLNKSPM